MPVAGSMPSWASGVSSDRTHNGWVPQLQQAQPQSQTQPELEYAEPSFASFEFLETQSAQDAEYARNATLPPLESVMDLTDAVRPPLRGEEPQMASTSAAGMYTGLSGMFIFPFLLLLLLLATIIDKSKRANAERPAHGSYQAFDYSHELPVCMYVCQAVPSCLLPT